MAESINDIAIKLSVDAAGVSKGFRTAAEEARSYKSELDRLVYAVGKNDPVDYNAHVQQFTQATNERLAREKKAQEEFNAWYRAEADKEFQAWYAVELRKEQVRNQQLAEERQRAINTVNSQRYQSVPEAETLGRAQQNDQLEAAIEARYALLDQEERALRDNAANRAAAQDRANADAQRLHEQDLQNLREYITQKYAILNQEEAIADMNAANTAEITRVKNLRAKQDSDADDAQRDADFAAYKADLARQEAEGLISAEKRKRIERARQRDAKRAADDDRVRQLNDWRQQQAMMQRAAVDTQLTVARMNGGFGGAAMAIGQASYAAEDFIQVLSMGGGLNMALMSASNNLSMVARSLMGTSAAMSALAGIGIPAVLIGLGLLTRYLMSTEDTADNVAKALGRFRKETEDIGKMTQLNQQAAAESRNIKSMTDSLSVEKKIAALKQEQLDLDQQMTQEDVKRTAQNQIIFDNILGGQNALLDFQNQLNKSMNQGTLGQRNAAAAYSKLLAEARESAIAGNEQSMFASLRKLHDMMTRADLTQPGMRGVDVGFMDNFKALFNDTALLDNLQGLFNPNITNLQENMEAQQKIAEELISQQEHMTEERKRQLTIAKNLLEAQEKHIELFQKEKQLRQDSTLFQLQATEAQKIEMSIRKQLVEYLGLTNTQPGQLDPSLLMGQSRQEAMDFLQAYNASLERSKQEILDEQRQMSPTGGMEQSAFKAQSEALQQMLEAQYKKEDPQLKDIDNHIQQGNQLLQQLTDGQGLVRVP